MTVTYDFMSSVCSPARDGAQEATPSAQPILDQLYLPFPSTLSPHTDTVETATLTWACEFDLIRNEKAIQRFCAAKFGSLAGRFYYGGDAERITLANQWLTWIFLLDDQCDNTPIGKTPAALSAYLDGFLAILVGFDQARPRTGSPLVASLEAFRQRAMFKAHPGWRREFILHTAAYFDGCVWEAGQRAAGKAPGVQEYLYHRRKTSAVDTFIDMLHITLDLPWSEEIYTHPGIRALVTCANDVIGWSNDTISSRIEGAQVDSFNLVAALQHEREIPLEQAAREAVDMTNKRVQEYITLERQLPSFGRQDADVRRFLIGLRCAMRGCLDWWYETGSYRGESVTDILDLACFDHILVA